MNELMNFWGQWLRPSAGLPTVQWALLLAVASVCGYLVYRHTGLPKVVGYSLIGMVAGLLGFGGAQWPLQGISLFLMELAISIVLFDAGGRILWRWFRHNPMVLVQSITESVLTYLAVYWCMRWLNIPKEAAGPIAIIAMAASPAVVMRVVADTRAAGPVTDRAIVLATLSTLYALTFGSAHAQMLSRPGSTFFEAVPPVMVMFGVSIIVGGLLSLLIRLALRYMSPASENTSILVLALIAAATAVAAHLGGSAPLAALLGGMLIKQLHQRPWALPRQLGTASSVITMLMFVLVSTVAAQADWSAAIAGAVLALIVVRLVAKAVGVGIGNVGSGSSWRQSVWVGAAMMPMSSIALLIASNFMAASATTGEMITRIALPTILLMEVFGAVFATVALYRAGETHKPWAALPVNSNNGEENRES